MINGITVRILGDSGPFSKLGKSIGYLITIGKSNYILDCGAQLFQTIGGEELKNINGLIVTHCHDDHKRWFTDFAIFYRYAPDIKRRVPLFTSEDVYNELVKMAEPALDRTLSEDSKTVIDVPYNSYVHHSMLGPRALYRMVSCDNGGGKYKFCVIDHNGNHLGPERAKIIISNKTGRLRMLFKDPEYNEWVEPESFYSFSSEMFYHKDKNVYRDPEGFTIEAMLAPVWHGIPNIGVKFRTDSETLIFSSDTVHDKNIWKELCEEKRKQKLTMTANEFEEASVIIGDINDYIERTWSRERYEDAVNSFHDAVVIHDISVRDSVVHTGYNKLNNTVLNSERTILTHSPDTITSEWPVCFPEKKLLIKGKSFCEIVGDKCFVLDADIYHKDNGKNFMGYRNEKGRYIVHDIDGMLYLSTDDDELLGRILYRVDLFEDIGGRYFPKLEENHSEYEMRNDGKVELVKYTEDGSSGEVVEDCRAKLTRHKLVDQPLLFMRRRG